MPAPIGHEPYNKNAEGGVKKIYTAEFIECEAKELEVWMNKRQENIFIEDFCVLRGYSYRRVNEWSKENERFADTYDKFQMRQRAALFKGGLTKKFNYPMCALILSHSHGVVAKTEQKLTGSAGDPLAFILQNVDGTSKDLINENMQE